MEDKFRNIVHETLKDINYEKVLLFGSRARGDSNIDSDYDLLVILKEKNDLRSKMKIATLIRKRLAQKFIDADVIVKTIEELVYYKDKIGSVVRTALAEGILI